MAADHEEVRTQCRVQGCGKLMLLRREGPYWHLTCPTGTHSFSRIDPTKDALPVDFRDQTHRAEVEETDPGRAKLYGESGVAVVAYKRLHRAAQEQPAPAV